MAAYYNEFEPYAAEWLRNLIKKHLIADGEVDERSIVDVGPAELREFTQCHFFAGIGVWSYALRLAGWPDDRPVWTGSCPCQPFSAAGKGKGFEDERHLWPVFHRFISECRPAVVFGEQVASKDGLGWLDTVFADLEGSGYAAGAVDMCAAGVGAPHIRQRLWFVGERLDHIAGPRHDGKIERTEGYSRHEARLRVSGEGCGPDGMEHAQGNGRQQCDRQLERGGSDGGMADAELHKQRQGGRPEGEGAPGDEPRLEPGGCGVAGIVGDDLRPRPTDGHWRDADWLFCRDGKWRPVEPGTFPLAHGAPARVGRLRAYGNAIVPQVAAEVIGAYLETENKGERHD